MNMELHSEARKSHFKLRAPAPVALMAIFNQNHNKHSAEVAAAAVADARYEEEPRAQQI